jgi:diguanylate cyclase (GGDEF)-like protein
MRDGTIRKSLSRGVGKRIFGLFLVAAVVPMMFTAWLAWSEINRGLEQESERALRSSAKEYGVRILTRLQLASDKAREIIRIARKDGLSSIYDHEYLVDDFSEVWVVRETFAPDTILEIEADGIEFSPSDEAHLNAGGTKLAVTGHNKLVLLQAVGDWAPGCLIAFELNADKIWGTRDNLPFNTEFCVFGANGEKLYCTDSVDAGIHGDLLAGADNSSTVFGEWNHAGETQFAAIWQLFLSGPLAAPAFDIVAMQPKAFAMRSGADFSRIFVPAVVLVLVLVVFLSFNLVARSLVPLQHLTIAATQLASGNLESRVRVRTGDEFEWLAEAFNNMAARLGRQISALEAMSGIDRMILSGTKFEDVSEDVVGHLISLTHCDAAAVIARDVDSPDKGKMISSYQGRLLHERIDLPGGVGHRWCQPRQVEIAEVGAADAPYKERFVAYEQGFVVLIPVVLNEDLKGVLLLGFKSEFDMSQDRMQRVVDLAGRFAVALSSVEREEILYRQAHFDALTGLPNRQLLKDRLDQHITSARVDEHFGALLFLDVDRFKEINDVFGHSVGDGLLIQAAKRITSLVRGKDTVARLGGDEFVVVLPNVRNEQTVRAMAERLLESLSEAFTVADVDHYVSASIGIVMFPDDGDSVETLLKNADAAMYRAKDAGRGRFEFFSKRLNAESRRKIGLERDLRQAFRDRLLAVHYQPQFDISSGEISGAEALLRWTHPEEGAISPEEFIPLAEDSGLIVELGAWVVEEACKDLCSILDNGFHPGPVSINVSARQLRETGFRRTILDAVRRYGIHPGYLQLEVTETAVAQNRDTAIQLLESLRSSGIRVAIDDFGTGYSSLSYLQQMPFDVIKIDKSFIDKIGSGVTSNNICRTIIRMAEELGKKSIAEGVETREQLDFLRRNGCNFVQGYFYSKPLARDRFIEFVEKQDFHTQRRKALEIL